MHQFGWLSRVFGIALRGGGRGWEGRNLAGGNCTRNNFKIICLKTKDGVYVINLDEYADVGTNWIVL